MVPGINSPLLPNYLNWQWNQKSFSFRMEWRSQKRLFIVEVDRSHQRLFIVEVDRSHQRLFIVEVNRSHQRLFIVEVEIIFCDEAEDRNSRDCIMEGFNDWFVLYWEGTTVLMPVLLQGVTYHLQSEEVFWVF